MSDGIKAWHEDMEAEARVIALKKLATWKPHQLLDNLEDLQQDIRYFYDSDLPMTRTQAARLESIRDGIDEILSGCRKVS